MKTCYIFGAAEGKPQNFTHENGDLIIAADAGFLKLKNIGATPDITVGDFDSLKEIPDCKKIIRHPVRKNDTDTMLAVKTGLSLGFRRFVIYGGTGGRLDHTLSNLQTLAFIAENGGKGYLCGDSFTATAVKNSSIGFLSSASGNISVFSATSKCRGVYITGLSYPLQNAVLDYSFPLGVSNEFTGEESEIKITNGTAIIIWSGGLDILK